MVYVIVFAALLFLTVKGYCGKRTSDSMRNTGDSYLFNLLRMIFCIFIGIALVFIEGAHTHLLVEAKMLWICILSGAANAALLIGWILAVRRNSLVSVDVSLTVGSILPAILCFFFFGEEISIPKMIGFALIVVATAVMAGKSKGDSKGGFIGLILLLIAAVGDGMSSFSQQLYKQFYTETGTLTHGVFYPKTVFHFYTYVFAALVLFIFYVGYRVVTSKKKEVSLPSDSSATDTSKKPQKTIFGIPIRVIIHIFVMAVCLFSASYFQTMATNDFGMSSQMLYPIVKGGCLITVNITALIFFGEKITKRNIIGSLVALGGIICMSIL